MLKLKPSKKEEKIHLAVSGSIGIEGAPGKDGANGKDGRDGVNGQDGAPGKNAYELAVEQGYRGTLVEWLISLKGEKGDQGLQGERGEQGLQGEQGPKGERGEQGLRGMKGDQGEQGPIGLTGAKGELGEQGPKGDKGEQGPKGDKGERGEKGPKGDKGEPFRFEDLTQEQVASLRPSDYVTTEELNSSIASVQETINQSIVDFASEINAKADVASVDELSKKIEGLGSQGGMDEMAVLRVLGKHNLIGVMLINELTVDAIRTIDKTRPQVLIIDEELSDEAMSRMLTSLVPAREIYAKRTTPFILHSDRFGVNGWTKLWLNGDEVALSQIEQFKGEVSWSVGDSAMQYVRWHPKVVNGVIEFPNDREVDAGAITDEVKEIKIPYAEIGYDRNLVKALNSLDRTIKVSAQSCYIYGEAKVKNIDLYINGKPIELYYNDKLVDTKHGTIIIERGVTERRINGNVIELWEQVS